MDNTELKEALMSSKPVILTHIDGKESEYKCVSAIVYRLVKGKILVSAELTDANSRSVVICDPKRIKVKP